MKRRKCGVIWFKIQPILAGKAALGQALGTALVFLSIISPSANRGGKPQDNTNPGLRLECRSQQNTFKLEELCTPELLYNRSPFSGAAEGASTSFFMLFNDNPIDFLKSKAG